MDILNYLLENGAYIYLPEDNITYEYCHLNGKLYLVDEEIDEIDFRRALYKDLWNLGIEMRITNIEYINGFSRNIQRQSLIRFIERYKNGNENEKQIVRDIINRKINDFSQRNPRYLNNRQLENQRFLNIRISPNDDATEEIITDPNFIHICNSGNEFEENEDPIDPISLEPIPSNRFVSVRNIFNRDKNISTCFDAYFLYQYWMEQSSNEAGITYKYAANPLNRGYFTEESVNYVKIMLENLNLLDEQGNLI